MNTENNIKSVSLKAKPDVPVKRRSGFNVMTRLIGLVKPLSGFMALAIIMGLAGHICAAGITVLGGYALLNISGGFTALSLGAVFVFALLFALFRALLRYGEQECNHYIAFKLLAIIRDKVFRALRRLCPAKLEGRDKGDLISVITSDIELLEVFYAHTISPAAIWILFTAAMCVFMLMFHWALALLSLLAYVTVGIIVPLIVSKMSGSDGLRLRNDTGELSGFVLDSLRGLSQTIQFGRGKNRLDEMNARTDNLLKDEEKIKRLTGKNAAAQGAAVIFFDILMIAVSSLLYMNGMVEFKGVLIPVLASFSSFAPSISLAALGSTLQGTFAAGNRVLDILDEEPKINEVTGKPETVFGGAKAEDVTFSYGSEAVLKNVSADIPLHSVTGITGKSGSGKSTLLKLFMRFWDAESGKISVSGSAICEINTADLRKTEAYVTQEVHLFHDSIRNNLLIAKPDATDEEIQEACRKASVHDFIMTLPKGYDTPVGELGDTLSGGERQRLGVARAFLHGAPFMLLDEPTSNLDSLNEAVILKSLHDEREGKTILLVSHRASTMRIADNVYCVEHGRMS